MITWTRLAFVGLVLIAYSEGDTTTDILRFETKGEFKEFIEAKNEMDLLELAQRMYDEDGYLSLLLMYNMNRAELDDIGLDARSMPIVHSYDDMLHLLLNRNGEIEIAGYTMRIDEDFVFKYKDGPRKVSEFLADYANGRLEIERGQMVDYKDLTVYMHNNNESITEDIAEDVEKRRVTATFTYFDYFSGGQYRMKSSQFNGWWLFYSSIGSSTKMQIKERYWFFGWNYRWKTVKRHNRLNYDLMYNMNSPTFPNVVLSANGNEHCFCKIARETYGWAVGQPVTIYYTPVAGSGETVHWAHEYSVSPNTEHRTIVY